jgi:cytochrome c oxidase assembly protein subunit 15
MLTTPMSSDSYQPWVHRCALATAAVALLPIVVGAIVTTLDAGMAFPDWPTSDGHNMLTYPWLRSAGDKFVEHGHRLAGMLIGITSIVLVTVVWTKEPRLWVRLLGTGVLLAVIAQGLLGGLRVRLDERVLAMLHGSSAALVFSLMAALASVTSRSWVSLTTRDAPQLRWGWLKPLAVITPAVILLQYVLGGLVRHLGTGLHEHLGTAFVALACALATCWTAQRSGHLWLRSAGWALLGVVILQLSLGAAAWVTRFGLPAAGYVAVQQSTLQVVVRTIHAVVGVLVLMTSVVLALRVLRLSWLTRCETRPSTAPLAPVGRVSMSGGVR